jgi:three-Cys-motif partner protein
MPKVDLSAYEGREQAYIKHCLLEEYLPDWAYKVGSQWDSLVYVDGFAGPWETTSPNYEDSSFGIAVDALGKVGDVFRHRQRKLKVQCVLVEENKSAYGKLEAYAVSKKQANLDVTPLSGEFVDNLPAISKIARNAGTNPFKFVFLDPKGWSDIPMARIASFLKDRSCEVLINLMTRHIIRFLEQDDRANSFDELFGRKEVLPLLRQTPNEDRADVAVHEYAASLKKMCGFKYVSSAVILEPNKEDKRYFLVYATNHPRGIEVFKAAETKAAKLQDEVRYEAKIQKTGQPDFMGIFDGTPKSRVSSDLWRRYCERAKINVIKRILEAGTLGVSYSDLFCEAMAFPLVTPLDLRTCLKSLEDAVEIRLTGSKHRRDPSPTEDDRVYSRQPEKLQAALNLGLVG